MTSDAQAYCTALKATVGEEDPMSILAETPSRIRSIVSGADATALRQRPRPGKWSIAEIIAHLSDSELVFGDRLRMMVAADGASLPAFDPDVWATTLAYESCDVQVVVEVFAALRIGNLHMLGRIAAPLLENSGRHEEWGSETVRGLILLEAGHDRNHLAQIERILGPAKR